jgi:hypothetical protein
MLAAAALVAPFVGLARLSSKTARRMWRKRAAGIEGWLLRAENAAHDPDTPRRIARRVMSWVWDPNHKSTRRRRPAPATPKAAAPAAAPAAAAAAAKPRNGKTVADILAGLAATATVQPAAAPTVQPTTPGPSGDQADADTDTDVGHRPATPDPATTRAPVLPPVDKPDRPIGDDMSTTTTPDQVFAGLHPAQVRVLEAYRAAIATFDPRGGVPDLHRFLKSLPVVMTEAETDWRGLGLNMANLFPGADHLHAYIGAVANMHGNLAERAAALFAAYETRHAADLDRHRGIRVNEAIADIVRTSNGGSIPNMIDGSPLHERAALIIGAHRAGIRSYDPRTGQASLDAIVDFTQFVNGISNTMYGMALQQRALADRLVQQYPIDNDIHKYWNYLIKGYHDTATTAGDVAKKHAVVYQHDLGRRADRRSPEWADVSTAVRAN